MSSANDRRSRRMAIQSGGIGGGTYEKVLNVPENVQYLKLEVMKPVVFDIIPITVDDHHPLYTVIKADSDKFGDPCDDWCVPYALHSKLQGVSQHVCRNWGKLGDRKCPTCDARNQAVSEGKDPKSDEVKQYNASQRVAMCVCPVGGEQDGEMVLLDRAKTWAYDQIKEAADRENIFLLDTSVNGMSIKATPQAFTYTDSKTKEKVTIPGELYIEFVPREFGYTSEDLAEALPICDYLNFKSYDEIYTMVHALTEMPKEENEEETVVASPEARQPNPNSRRGRGVASMATSVPATPASTSDTTETPAESPRSRGRRARAMASTAPTDADEEEIMTY